MSNFVETYFNFKSCSKVPSRQARCFQRHSSMFVYWDFTCSASTSLRARCAGGINFLWENLYPQHPPGPYPYYEDPRYFPAGTTAYWTLIMRGCFRFASRNLLIHDRCSCWILFWTCREGAFQAAQKSEIHDFEVLFTLTYHSEARNSMHFLRLSLKSYRDCGLMDRIHLTSTMPSLSYQIHPRSARHCQSHSFTTCRVLGNGLAGSFPPLFLALWTSIISWQLKSAPILRLPVLFFLRTFFATFKELKEDRRLGDLDLFSVRYGRLCFLLNHVQLPLWTCVTSGIVIVMNAVWLCVILFDPTDSHGICMNSAHLSSLETEAYPNLKCTL